MDLRAEGFVSFFLCGKRRTESTRQVSAEFWRKKGWSGVGKGGLGRKSQEEDRRHMDGKNSSIKRNPTCLPAGASAVRSVGLSVPHSLVPRRCRQHLELGAC